MNEPKNKKALETGSGVKWERWLELLEPHQELNHTEMAKIVHQEIVRVGGSKSPEWWAQGVTVAYEQAIGRRKPGQRCDGDFSVTVSKTVLGDMDEALVWWSETMSSFQDINGIAIKGQPRTSASEKWRYWRVDLADGSKVSVNIQTKPGRQKSSLAINHDRLSSPEKVENMRNYWKTV